jgi:hypothetical protein
MSILDKIRDALSGVAIFEGTTPSGGEIPMGEGKYPDGAGEPCGKVVFTGKDKPVNFMGGGQAGVETFRVVLRGDSYAVLETKAGLVKSALTGAGFIQTGGYEDIEPKEGETALQIAVGFKTIG